MEKRILEYNQKSKQFHRITIDEACKYNLRTVIDNNDNSWLPIAYGTDDYLDKVYSELTEKYGL